RKRNAIDGVVDCRHEIHFVVTVQVSHGHRKGPRWDWLGYRGLKGAIAVAKQHTQIPPGWARVVICRHEIQPAITVEVRRGNGDREKPDLVVCTEPKRAVAVARHYLYGVLQAVGDAIGKGQGEVRLAVAVEVAHDDARVLPDGIRGIVDRALERAV